MHPPPAPAGGSAHIKPTPRSRATRERESTHRAQTSSSMTKAAIRSPEARRRLCAARTGKPAHRLITIAALRRATGPVASRRLRTRAARSAPSPRTDSALRASTPRGGARALCGRACDHRQRCFAGRRSPWPVPGEGLSSAFCVRSSRTRHLRLCGCGIRQEVSR